MHFNIADLYESLVDVIGGRDAAVCGDRRLTFKQLDERANRLAHYPQSRGVGAGDHVGMYLYNCIEFLEGMLALFKIRAVPININYRYVAGYKTPRQLHIVEHVSRQPSGKPDYKWAKEIATTTPV